MAKEITTYIHHGRRVSAAKENMGKHRENCLCLQCANFYPDCREKNCRIANLLFAIDCAFDITTPVWECPEFLQKMRRQSNEIL